jgi:hypothetical protein
MTEGDEVFSNWVPVPGEIVRLKPGFKGSIEELAFKRSSEEGGPKLELDENTLYAVVTYEADQDRRSLHLQEVNIIYVAGERFVIKGDKVPYPVSMKLFQLAREHKPTVL